MLGSFFLKSLAGREDFEMYAFGKDDFDITDFKAVKDHLNRISPDYVINCCAYTAVDDCEGNKELAFNVNAHALGHISKICNELDSILLHFSTDYVFAGDKKDGYKESDPPNPCNVYGESKLQGEINIIKNTDKYYIIRTSWLYGPNGKNFVNTMINLAKTKKELNVVSDQFGSPTYTSDLCESVYSNFMIPFFANIKRMHEYHFSKKVNHKKLDFGIYHLCAISIQQNLSLMYVYL